MEDVIVLKADLVKYLKENAEEHRQQFLEAQDGWREYIIKQLDERLEDARSGRKVNHSFNIPSPEDHSVDYQRVIKMVEMSIEDTLKISENEFAKYVMDDWDWKVQWSGSNTMYMKRKN